MTLKIVLFLLSGWLANPANDHAMQIASDLDRYGEKYDVDPILLAVMAYQESSMRTDRVGDLGEVGMFQVHGLSRRACKAAGIQPLGVECGAFLLDMNRRFCGSMKRGLHRYMSGDCRGTPRARRKTAARLQKVERLKARFE
jgi:hypothetical protein